MTAKEKALYLFQEHAKQWHASPDETKMDAMITVSEIEKLLAEMRKPENCIFWQDIGKVQNGFDVKSYWNEVKNEIEKL